MRRALIALVAAAVIVGATTVAFIFFEVALGPAFAFWPGFIVQRALEQVGILTTNRILPWTTLLFWWLAIWLALSLVSRRRPMQPNSALLTDTYTSPLRAQRGAAKRGR
jgi:hypothetical protein